MRGKQLASALIALAITYIGAYHDALSPTWQMWIGIVGMLLTAVLSSPIFATAGTSWPMGWKWSTWVTAILGIFLMVLTQLPDAYNLPVPPDVIAKVTLGVQLLLSFFVKNYPDGGTGVLGGAR